MDLKNKTRKELLEVAKELGVTKRSNKNEKKLISSIIEARQNDVVLVSKKRLVEEARLVGIKNATSLCKEELRKVIENEKKVKDDPESNATIRCIHKRDYDRCLICKEKRLCIHGTTKYFCKECGGSLICKHDKKIFNCYECSETRRKMKRLGGNFKKKVEEALDRFETEFRKDSLPHFGSFLSELGLSKDAVREGVEAYEKFVEDFFEKNSELVRGLADENVIDEVTDELKEKAKAVSFVLLKAGADSDGRDDALHADVDWITDEESESCGEGSGCLIERYDNIYDFVADLNAKDD